MTFPKAYENEPTNPRPIVAHLVDGRMYCSKCVQEAEHTCSEALGDKTYTLAELEYEFRAVDCDGCLLGIC